MLRLGRGGLDIEASAGQRVGQAPVSSPFRDNRREKAEERRPRILRLAELGLAAPQLADDFGAGRQQDEFAAGVSALADTKCRAPVFKGKVRATGMVN